MTLRQVLTEVSNGAQYARSAEEQAIHATLSAPRGQWREASALRAEEAARHSALAKLADALFLTLESPVLDQVLTTEQQQLFTDLLSANNV